MIQLRDGKITLAISRGDRRDTWEGDAVEIVLESQRIRRRFAIEGNADPFGEHFAMAVQDLGFDLADETTALQLLAVAEERFSELVDHLEREVAK